MTSRTHIAFGITASLLILNFTKDNMNLLEYIPGTMLGSFLPDVDTPKSWAAQIIPYADDKLRSMGILKHRGLMHGGLKLKKIQGIKSMLRVFSVWGVIYLILQYDFVAGFAIGYVAHILLDLISNFIKKLNCKTEDGLFKFIWIINTGIVVNNIIGLKNIYEFIIKLWR